MVTHLDRTRWDEITHFTAKEMECPCCEVSITMHNLMAGLDLMRIILGRPMDITSGYRCDRHNRHVGGVKKSFHPMGMAADIRTGQLERWDVVRAAYLAGCFHGIGIYTDIIHVDTRPQTQRIIWKGKK